MSKGKKATTQPKNRNAVHKHGGNRPGSHKAPRPRHSAQSFGKDPHRGSGE